MENKNTTTPQFDAIAGESESGVLRDRATIRVAVCYILENVKEDLTADIIIEAMTAGEIANYYEASAAVTDLIQDGIIDEQENGTLHLSSKGASSVEFLEDSLPKTVREKSIGAVMKLAAREMYKKQTRCTVEKAENGWRVILHVNDKENDFMTLTLYTASKEQAVVIQEKFTDDPVKVYNNLIQSIFSNE